MGATVTVMDQSASAIPALSLGKHWSRSDMERGIIGPATKPCMILKPMSISMFHEIPQRNDEITKSKSAPRNSFICPMRLVSHPVSGTATALETANDVITHVP